MSKLLSGLVHHERKERAAALGLYVAILQKGDNANAADAAELHRLCGELGKSRDDVRQDIDTLREYLQASALALGELDAEGEAVRLDAQFKQCKAEADRQIQEIKDRLQIVLTAYNAASSKRLRAMDAAHKLIGIKQYKPELTAAIDLSVADSR